MNMKTWIVLLRGINVGGNNIIKMQDLRALLTDAGYANVRTYIQSGNVAFETDNTDAKIISKHIQDTIESSYGFAPKAMALSAQIVTKIIKDIPFSGAAQTPKEHHVFFLSEPALSADMDSINALKTETEQFALTPQAAYLHLPNGVWKSKLAAKLEACLGVPTTARNWRSTIKLLELAEK